MAINSPNVSSPGQGLPDLVAGIPFANDGDTITRDHHNMLRSAVGHIAAALDQGQVDRVQTLSFTPVLLPVVGTTPWQTSFGYTLGAPSATSAEGWMALELPHGTSIDTMTVRGRMSTPVQVCAVTLQRLEIAGSQSSTICTREIQTAPKAQDGSFIVDVPVRTEQLTPAQAAELRRVDTTKYRYMFYSSMNGAQPASSVELWLMQVTCTQG